MVGLHECTPVDDDEPVANRRASLTTPAKPKPPDELTDTFSKARKYIQSDTFMYNFWMTALLRHLLYLNHVPGFYTGDGGFRFMNSFEGEDVTRFFIVHKVTRGTMAIEALRGGAVSKAEKCTLRDGMFDLRTSKRAPAWCAVQTIPPEVSNRRREEKWRGARAAVSGDAVRDRARQRRVKSRFFNRAGPVPHATRSHVRTCLTQASRRWRATCLTQTLCTMCVLHSFIGTPRPIEQVITISQPTVHDAADILLSSNLVFPFVGVTVDCCHGESKMEVVRDLEGKNYMVGGATNAEDLVGAALTAEQLGGRRSLDDKDIAKSVMTVVLHDFDGHHQILVAVIPVNSETGPLIANIALRLRQYLFEKNLYLIYGGGDNHKANLGAWDIVKQRSSGSEHTKLSSVLRPEMLPFVGGTDTKEHNLKHLWNQAKGVQLLIGGESIRLDRSVADLRGVIPTEGAVEWKPAPVGDYQHSRFRNTPIVQLVKTAAAAESLHRDVCKLVTKQVLEAKDPMATDPAVKVSQLGPIFRRLGLGAKPEAEYCEFLAKVRAYSRGVDTGRALL